MGLQGAFGDGSRRIRFLGGEIEGESAGRELELWGILGWWFRNQVQQKLPVIFEGNLNKDF